MEKHRRTIPKVTKGVTESTTPSGASGSGRRGTRPRQFWFRSTDFRRQQSEEDAGVWKKARAASKCQNFTEIGTESVGSGAVWSQVAQRLRSLRQDLKNKVEDCLEEKNDDDRSIEVCRAQLLRNLHACMHVISEIRPTDWARWR